MKTNQLPINHVSEIKTPSVSLLTVKELRFLLFQFCQRSTTAKADGTLAEEIRTELLKDGQDAGLLHSRFPFLIQQAATLLNLTA